MTQEELVQRIEAHRKRERSITLPVILPLLVIWLAGSWLIIEEVILADRSFETKGEVMLALMLLLLLGEAAAVWVTYRKSAFRAHGLLCPQCDGRILGIWNPRKVLETGRCHHCGYALVALKSA